MADATESNSYPERVSSSDATTRAAYAVATAWRRSQHGQCCPVWTKRRDASKVDTCDCWILRNARMYATLALTAAADEHHLAGESNA